jgi:hypothetical protein
MIKVVSIALFGEDAPAYSRYLRAFVRGHLNVFPLSEGWRLRVHVDSVAAKSDAGKLIRAYAAEGLCDSVIMYGATTATPPLCWAMLWRMDPVFAPGVDYVFPRDLDSPPMPRDRACCEQFMASKAAVHTIHDAEAHTGVMGGLCGFWSSEFRKLSGFQRLDEVYTWANFSPARWGIKGADQDALNRMLGERQLLTLLEHRFNGWKSGPGKLPARQPSMYSCEAFSTRAPDKGHALGGSSQVMTDAADHLGAHLGCAGYDIEAAIKFWDEHGNSGVAESIRQCEAKL